MSILKCARLRVSSHSQRAGLDWQVARLTVWAAQCGRAVVRVEAEAGSRRNARSKARRLFADPGVQTVVAGHRDRLGRMNTELVESALSARMGAERDIGPQAVVSAGRQDADIEVSCCVCGTVRQVRPSLVKGYTHLVCGPCSKAGRGPDVPSRAGMVLVRTFGVAGFFDGYTYRIATAEERASIARAAALARAVFLGAPGERGPDG